VSLARYSRKASSNFEPRANTTLVPMLLRQKMLAPKRTIASQSKAAALITFGSAWCLVRLSSARKVPSACTVMVLT